MAKFQDLADGLPDVIKTRKLGPLEQAEQTFKNALLNLQTLKRPGNRPIELRSSGLPFCPIKAFLLDERGGSYSMDHYVTTGTAIHETLQKWLPLGDYRHLIFGNWKCSECGKMKKMRLQPQEACKCGSNSMEWLYVEVAFKYKKLTGHIDLILKIGKHYVIVDFKSTDMFMKRAKVNWDPSQPSSKNYIIQIRTYCTIMNLQQKLPIAGWLLPSINRAQPIFNDRDFHMLSGEWSERMSRKWLKYLNDADYDYGVLLELMKSIKDEDTEAANSALKEMVKTRPCHSEEDYDKWMAYAFYGADKCPLKGICTKGKSKLVLSNIKQKLREKT